jgi:hypothetical protein
MENKDDDDDDDVCGTYRLSVQCSVTVVRLHSEFGYAVYETRTVMFLFYWDKTVRQQQGGGEN